MERLAKGPGRLGTCGSHALNSSMDHAVLDNSGSTQMRKKISAMNILPGETRDTWENKERGIRTGKIGPLDCNHAERWSGRRKTKCWFGRGHVTRAKPDMTHQHTIVCERECRGLPGCLKRL